jgi:hypothetical protein
MSSRNDSGARPSFPASLGVGLILSFCGAAALSVLGPVLFPGYALRAVIAVVAFAYVLYLIGKSGERVGRVTTVACWLVVALGAAVVGLPLGAYVLVHVGLVWLVRSLYYYSGVLPALADFGVGLLGVVFATWAAQRTGSVWLAFWCFFLAQSFHVLIPQSLATQDTQQRGAEDSFNRAHRMAEEAIRRLSTAR